MMMTMQTWNVGEWHVLTNLKLVSNICNKTIVSGTSSHIMIRVFVFPTLVLSYASYRYLCVLLPDCDAFQGSIDSSELWPA